MQALGVAVEEFFHPLFLALEEETGVMIFGQTPDDLRILKRGEVRVFVLGKTEDDAGLFKAGLGHRVVAVSQGLCPRSVHVQMHPDIYMYI